MRYRRRADARQMLQGGKAPEIQRIAQSYESSSSSSAAASASLSSSTSAAGKAAADELVISTNKAGKLQVRALYPLVSLSFVR